MIEAYSAASTNMSAVLGRGADAKIMVPQFQREYSWAQKHVEAFWKDILAFHKERSLEGGPKKYFLGPIVVMPDGKTGVRALLDGQQRLATATILFSVIRDVIRTYQIQEATDSARDVQTWSITASDGAFSLTLGDIDKEYFIDTIQRDPPLKKKAVTKSHRNIDKAKSIFNAEIAKFVGGLNPQRAIKSLNELWDTVLKHVVMASIPVESERDAFRIFETLNHRGLRLSAPDLLLNKLMQGADTDADRSSIRTSWNEMLESMGGRRINDFLRHMWISRHGDEKGRDLFTAISEDLKSKETSSLAFAKECAEVCESYTQLIDSGSSLGLAKTHVDVLIRKLEAKSALPLLLSCYSLPTKEFQQAVKHLIVFVVRYSVIANLDSSGMEDVLFGLAKDVFTGDMIKQPTRCVSYIKDVLRRNSPADAQILIAVENLVLAPEPAKYLIRSIAYYLQTNTKEVAPGESNLEHIFPKNPSADWRDKELLEPLLWHIGNLTWMGQRLNRGVGNSGYEKTKRDIYLKTSELEITRDIGKTYATWDERTIIDRAKKLAGHVIKIWDFDNHSFA